MVRLYFTVFFIEINGAPYRRLAKIQDDGNVIPAAMEGATPDSAVWGGWTSPSGPVMGAGISVVEKLPDGKLLPGGRFSSFGGEPYNSAWCACSPVDL